LAPGEELPVSDLQETPSANKDKITFFEDFVLITEIQIYEWFLVLRSMVNIESFYMFGLEDIRKSFERDDSTSNQTKFMNNLSEILRENHQKDFSDSMTIPTSSLKDISMNSTDKTMMNVIKLTAKKTSEALKK
jgi:hypothetical protein